MRSTVLLVALCAGCGHVSNQAGTAMTVAAIALVAQVLAPPSLEGRAEICPEYRNIRCVASTLCAWNDELGCNVCRCAALLQNGPTGVAADVRVGLEVSLPSQWVPPPK